MIEEIRACQRLFGANITGNRIAADWCDEQGTITFSTLAALLRRGNTLTCLFISGGGRGNGNGSGYGSGYGFGSGNGSGNSRGNGNGIGIGNGNSRGNSSGSGNGGGSGYGRGYGRGYGSGDGRGLGRGYIPKLTLIEQENNMPNEGDYVVVRSDKQGVVWGTLVWRVGCECRLKDCRQQDSWGRKALNLFDIVILGPEETELRLSRTVPEIDMTEICGVILVPPEMVERFKKHPHTDL